VKALRLALAATAVVVALAVMRQLVTEPVFYSLTPNWTVIVVGVGLVVAFGGLLVWQSRPQRSTGPLLTVTGFAVLLGAFAGLEPGSVHTTGSVVLMCFPLVIGHVLLAYPDGLPRRWNRAAVAACWVVPALLSIAMHLVAASWDVARLVPYIPYSYRRHQAPISDQADLARTFAALYDGWVGLISVVVAGAVLVRAHRSNRALRPTVVPVAWAGAAWSLAMLGSIPFAIRALTNPNNVISPPWKVYELIVVAGVILPAVTVALVAGTITWAEVLRPRLDPARDGRIVLSGEPLPVAETLRRRLARAVGDPSLQLAIHGPDGRWFAPSGKPVDLRDDHERATTTLTRDGQVIAAVEYDHALRATPDLVVVATTMAGLAIDNVRLAALDVAQVEEMRNSGAALLEAADRARHRLAATIADGPAAKLEELAARAANGVDKVELQRALRDIAVEVRTISHGLYPPELEKSGLSAALDLAAEVPSRRYPPAVELTAYLVAAGRSGARLIHDDGRLVITMSGAVPEHAAVRVEALDGTIAVDGDVTTVVIPVPE
jgi:signal transduction histidine kinase